MTYKPEGYTSVSPYLLVADANACLAFLRSVFAAEVLRVYRDDAGRVMHAEARIEDSVVMMGETPDAAGANVHVYVPDVDAAFARALEAGATEVQAPQVKDDPDRRGGVRDTNGTTWWISTQQGSD